MNEIERIIEGLAAQYSQNPHSNIGDYTKSAMFNLINQNRPFNLGRGFHIQPELDKMWWSEVGPGEYEPFSHTDIGFKLTKDF